MRARALPCWLLPLSVALALAVLGAFFLGYWDRYGAEVYKSFASPDGRFELVVYRHSVGFMGPGQSGDAPGYLELREVQTGRVLGICDVEMVQLVENVDWSPANVHVRLLTTWSLPP